MSKRRRSGEGQSDLTSFFQKGRGRAIAEPADAGGRIKPGVERRARNPRDCASKNIKLANAGDRASSQIPFVIRYAVRIQKSYELVSERFFLMMLFLSRNVILDFLNIRLADSERSITALPGKILQIGKHIMHPSARVSFEIAQNVRQRLIWSQFCKQMNVIFHAIDRQRNSTQSANRSADVFVKTRLMGVRDQRLAIFCGEDDVINQVRECLSHNSS